LFSFLEVPRKTSHGGIADKTEGRQRKKKKDQYVKLSARQAAPSMDISALLKEDEEEEEPKPKAKVKSKKNVFSALIDE
jgi:hypothetical protein